MISRYCLAVNKLVLNYIHPPYILDTFTKLERSESEVPQYERETTIGLWGQDPFRVV